MSSYRPALLLTARPMRGLALARVVVDKSKKQLLV